MGVAALCVWRRGLVPGSRPQTAGIAVFFIQRAAFALVHSGQLTLTLCFVQNQGGSHRDVQRLHHADHRNDDVLIGERQRVGGNAGFFLPEQDAGGRV